MKADRVLKSLFAQRCALAEKIEAAEKSFRKLVVALDVLDTSIRAFGADIDLEEIRPKSLSRRHAGFKREVALAVLKTIRETPHIISAQQITLRFMAERGLSTTDTELVDAMRRRVGGCLRHWSNKETVQSEVGAKGVRMWQMAQ